tara:strand:- start:283 stop:867 length:585 start_codon:yes stop_codon:yes gene_type:complete
LRIILITFALIFSLQSWSKADDIKEFEIEGMSIKDSLLDYFSENEIEKKINSGNTFFYNKDYMSISLSYKTGKFKVYDDVGAILKQNDKQYKIYSLEGTLIIESENIEDCYKKQNSIAKEIEKIIDSKYKRDLWFVEKERLRPHQLSVKYLDFRSTSGRKPFSIVCYEMKANPKYSKLYVVVDSEEFDKYLNTH